MPGELTWGRQNLLCRCCWQEGGNIREGCDGAGKDAFPSLFSFRGSPSLAWGKECGEVLREAMCTREDWLTQPQSGTGCPMTSLSGMSGYSLRSRQDPCCWATWRRLLVNRSFGNYKATCPEHKCQFTWKHKLPTFCGKSLLYLSRVHIWAGFRSLEGLAKTQTTGPHPHSWLSSTRPEPKSVRFQRVLSTWSCHPGPHHWETTNSPCLMYLLMFQLRSFSYS